MTYEVSPEFLEAVRSVRERIPEFIQRGRENQYAVATVANPRSVHFAPDFASAIELGGTLECPGNYVAVEITEREEWFPG